MKNILKRLSCLFVLWSTISSCYSQQLVQTKTDAKKLEVNESRFIGKPLKELLKEIKPKIKSAIGNPTNVNREVNTSITFYFEDKASFIERDKKGEKPIHIEVVFKQNFDNPPTRELGKPSKWTKEDEEAYGNMIIGYIRVRGLD